MEWEMASWGVGEVKRRAEPTIVGVGSTAVVAPGSGQKGGSDCSVDLKLGGFGCSEGGGRGELQKQRVAGVGPGSSKRARAPGGGGGGSQNVACMVDGCTSDLSNSKEYHRRHKVCEAHSKTPVVLVGGQQQRFCQQCSRFHLLVEFDEVKRSCRKRLDGHNRRRRKPQPDPLNPSRFLSGFKGIRYSPIPPLFSTGTQHPSWSPPFYPNGFKEGKQLPFMQGTGTGISSGMTLETPDICQPIYHGISFSESSNGSGKIYEDRLSQVLDSECALSLLSSTAQTSGIDLGRIVSANHVQIMQPLPPGQQQYGDMGRLSRLEASDKVSLTGFSYPATNGDRVDANLVSHDGDMDLHCHGIFHGSGEGSPSHALPFSWQ